MNLKIRISAGKIRRYHTAPMIGEQTVGDHTYNVCQILRYILDDNVSSQLLRAALDHDVVEYFTGDIPFPTKTLFPDFAAHLNSIENIMEEQEAMGHQLNERDAVCLRAADMLEACMYGLHQLSLGNQYGKNIMDNIFTAFKHLDSAIVPQKAKDLLIELENCYVS